MNVETTHPGFLLLFDHQRVRLGKTVLAHARHLPRNLYIGNTGADGELVVGDFAAYDGLGKLANHRQLISEVGVEDFKPVWQVHRGLALRVGSDVAGVDVHHLRRFHGRVSKVLVGGVEGMVDSEILDGGKDLVTDIDAAGKVSGKTAACQPKYAVAGIEGIRSSLEKSTIAVSGANAAWTSPAAEA